MTKINDALPPKSEAKAVGSSESEEKHSAPNENGSNDYGDGTNDQTDDADTDTELKGEKNQVQDNIAAAALKVDDGAEITFTTATEDETIPSTSEDDPSSQEQGDAEEERFCGICTDGDHQGDFEDDEEEANDTRITVNANSSNPANGRGPGAFRVFPSNRNPTTTGNTNANAGQRQMESDQTGQTGQIDIESELSRLGIPMVEAELVPPPEETSVLTAESRHSPAPAIPTTANNANAVGSTLPEEVDDNVYQAEHIPTVHICGKEMTRSTATLLACVVALSVAVAVIVPVSVTQANKSSAKNALEEQTVLSEMDREEAARQSRIIDEITSFAKGDVTDPDLPHGQALEWMLGPENAQLDSSGTEDEQGLIMMKQRFTMALFYYTTGGERWHAKDNFLGEQHVCEWSTMIVCNDEDNNQEVKELQFGNNNLQGNLPQELLYFDTLTTLNLTGNLGLTGSILPEIGEIASLEILDLHDTKFMGTIPDSFANLIKLTHLDLQNNFLSGGLQYRDARSTIGSLKELRYLDLSKNVFTDTEPDSLFLLTNLEYLDISDNEFGNSGDVGYQNGAIMPSTIGALAKLKVFNVANNNLGGAIHPSIAKCKRLEELHLSGNGFTEGIPSELGQLKVLRVLDISNNVRLGGTIPTALGALSNLKTLNLKDTGLAGSLPEDFGRGMNMDALILDLNSLTGSIPGDIFNMKNMKELRLASNSLNGSIPAEVGNATGLRELTLFENYLEGPLPPEIGNLVNLTSLVLGWNELNSTLPETLGNLVNLERFIFDENLFTGQLPTTLGNLKELKEIHGTNNAFNGTFPSELGRLTALLELGLNENEFTGTIPTELGNLSNLWFLKIGGNPLSGTVPGWIGTSKLGQSLRQLEIAYSNLEGTLPAEWGMLSGLRKLKMHRNPLITGTIPLEWANMTKLDGMWMFNTSLTGSVSHLCREDFENFGSQDCEDCGLEVDLEDVECDCCACCINNEYLETDDDDDNENDDDGNENDDLDESDIVADSS